jgi:hypothetical protein
MGQAQGCAKVCGIRQEEPALPTPDEPSDAPSGSRRLVVLQHGIIGKRSDLDAVRCHLQHVAKEASLLDIEVWDSPCNEGWRTHQGVERCARRLWAALRLRMEELVSAGELVRVSMIGHSLGGLFLRRVAAELHAWAQVQPAGRVILDAYVSIASPHLGTRCLGVDGEGGVGPLVRSTTLFLRMLLRTVSGMGLRRRGTGRDLLLDSTTLDGTLVNDAHCEALRAFTRRICCCNTQGDWAVPLASGSLCDADELCLVRHISRLSASPLWAPDEAELSAPIQCRQGADALTQALRSATLTVEVQDNTDGAASCFVRLSELPADWNPRATAALHRTWDDCGGGYAARACDILVRLRGCGDWQLLPVTFGRRASFAGGLRCPHVDIIALPGQSKTDAAEPVVRAIVRMVLTPQVLTPGDAFAPRVETRPTDGREAEDAV